MVFVDTNVFVYAVGRPHPLRDEAKSRLRAAVADGQPLATSAEVLQELLHIYLPVDRTDTLDAALRLANDLTTVWPIDATDVASARDSSRRYRDRRRGTSSISQSAAGTGRPG